jgi:tRNA threonylcarbamoyladenosine biosynthesis protein TsaB
MFLLAADTSGKNGSLALARVYGTPTNETSGALEVLEVIPLEGGTFSAQLVPQISALLQKHKLGKHHIGAFAVVSGPGSFTGLRVGLAAIKAFAEILHKPIAAVSRLEALARSSSLRGRIVSAIDAGRGELYVGEYEIDSKSRLVAERLLTREEFLTEFSRSRVVTADPILADAARRAGMTVEQVAEPRSDVIARLGWEKIQAGQTTSPDELEANYIRRSDAEIFAKPSQRISD